MPHIDWSALEAATVALNEWLYAQEAGLDAPSAAGEALGARLAGLYDAALSAGDIDGRSFLIESWADARRVPRESALTAARDAALHAPELASSAGPLTWRNWKVYEREAASGAALQAGFDALLVRSASVVPALEAYHAGLRADYAQHGLTPVDTFCEREGLGVEALRTLLLEVGNACREEFQAVLGRLSGAVFARPAGPAELRALYLNRMYEPHAGLFDLVTAVPRSLAAFGRMGFALAHVPVDVEDRPLKYPGAFCFPVHTPSDVRVSVRLASAHHLVDMLYHELGHAVHFSGIAPAASFLDRYWLTSGIHETFSTLFESLLSEPLFLEEEFGFGPQAIEALLAFGRFKDTLTVTWLGAAALTVLEAWQGSLDWAAIEQLFAANLLAFTGVRFPPAFARLEPFTAHLSIYPAGYVLAWARVGHWRQHLRALGGEAWWRSPAAQSDVRARVAAGGAGMFPAGWSQPDGFLAALRDRPIMGGTP